MRGETGPDLLKNHHKGAAAGSHLAPRIQRQQHQQRADVKNQHAVDHLIHRLGDGFLRVLGLRRRHAYQFQAAKGEHDHRHRHEQASDAVREEAAIAPQIAHRGLRTAVSGQEQIAAEHDHRDDRAHLDQREPELRLAVIFDAAQIDAGDHREEDQRGDPSGHIRPPVTHVFAGGRQFGHAGQHIQRPVIPAGQEGGKLAPVAIGEMAERAGHRLLGQHLAQLAHDQENDEAGDGVAENHSRSGRFQHAGRAQEETSADRAAQRDQLNMAVFQLALQTGGSGGNAHLGASC